MLFVNLPVTDLSRARAFWEALGFAFDDRISDDRAASMLISEQTHVMLMAKPFFASFHDRQPVDARTHAQVVLALSAPSRDGVHELVDAALAAGGAPAGDAEDHGFMVSRPFADPDGNLWNVVWMDVEAASSEGHLAG
ncbi:VOC family protein [Angustibacter aerolatus]